jgi:hypothetical protein
MSVLAEEQVALGGRCDGKGECLVVGVVQCHEAKTLKNGTGRDLPRMQHLRHAVNRARKCLERDLNQIAFGKRFGQLQEAAIHRNSLDSSFRVLSIIQFDQCGSKISKLDSRRAVGRVRLGEVGHSSTTMSRAVTAIQITKDRQTQMAQQ